MCRSCSDFAGYLQEYVQSEDQRSEYSGYIYVTLMELAL